MSFLAFLSSLIVLITIIARADDHLTRPTKEGWLPLLRLHVEKIAMLMVGVAAGWLALTVIVGIEPCGVSVALMTGTALWMMAHPSGWFCYVFFGRGRSDYGTRQA